MSRFTQDSALAFLRAAGVFYEDEPDPDPEYAFEKADRTLNMNDVWGWALAWGEYVPDDKLAEVAELCWRYGWAGCLYWVSEQHGQMRSEFHDNNRMVDFVRNEERIRGETPDSSARAYRKVQYTLGVPSDSATEVRK